MGLLIHYDLIDKINEAKEEFTLKREMKNRIPYITRWFSICTAANLSFGDPTNDSIIKATVCTSSLFALLIASDVMEYKQLGDVKRGVAIEKLNKLSTDLCELNIETSYDLLLDSKEYDRKHKRVQLSENIIPILQEKYIMVPTYDNGKIKETSLLQEHLIGSKDYVLSLSSPTKSKIFKPIHAKV